MVTLFNFQGSVASELSFVSFSILSHRFRFVKYFFQDFLIFIFELASRFLCDSSFILSHRVLFVKHFFRLFSKSFFACLASKLSQIRAPFPSFGRLFGFAHACLSATASLSYHTNLPLSTTFFAFFRSFFSFVN